MVRKTKGKDVNRKWLVLATAAAVVAAFVAGIVVFRDRSDQAAGQALRQNSEALVRLHSPV